MVCDDRTLVEII